MSYTRREIETEYDQAAEASEEFEKVKWGSQRKMLNRFRLAMECADFGSISRWLDVGCGTGAFQGLVRAAYPQVAGIAIDLSPKLLNFASSRSDTAGIDFRLVDFMELDDIPFDLITSVGVLQKTTMSANDFFSHAAELLVPGGHLFVDTKHAGWKRFAEPGFLPEPTHDWFTADELRNAVTASGLSLELMQGFDPDTAKVVSLEESHTIFLFAQKGPSR